MNYTLKQLQVYLEVVKCMSITDAAKNLHMSQPALSIQLKNFQKIFHDPLIQVIGRKVHVTEFGYSISALSERIVNEAELLRQKTKDFSGQISGNIRIATVESGKYILPGYLSDFMISRSEIDVEMDIRNQEDIIRMIRKNKIDFALVPDEKSRNDMNEEFLLENKQFLVGDSKVINKKKPFLFLEETNGDQMLKKWKGKKPKTITFNSEEMIKQAVVSGLGYSVLPLCAIRNELDNQQLHTIPSKGLPIVNQWKLIWLKEKKLSPAAHSFVSYIQKNKEHITQNKFSWHLKFRG